MLTHFLSACTTTPELAERYVAQDEWFKAVIEYRKAYAKNPGDVGLRSRLKQAELKAADYYYQQGLKLIDQDNIDGAIVMFQQGLVAKSDHAKLSSAMKDVLARKEANAIYQEALIHNESGQKNKTKKLLIRALQIYPDHVEASELLNKLKDKEEEKMTAGLSLISKEPITLNFRDTDIKTVFEFLAQSFGVNVIFDRDVKEVPVSMFVENVTFEQALKLLLGTTKTYYRRLGYNTILIAPDTKEKRGQYEDYHIRVFHLNITKAKDMANLLKGVLSLKKVIINDNLNTLVIRDTKNVLDQVEKLIAVNDQKPAELIFDVEILEVNRTKSEQLGFDFGSQISVAFSPFTVSGSYADAIRSGTVTLSSVAFNYFKQDVDAKTLANPKIRVINNKPAKIHIGDRIPLRSSTILDATGQTRTTFEYRDIGIRLNVLPEIHMDNSVTVKLELEVSSLGQNLGTQNEPAFSIGTRNSETYMLLRDGETAILGGLIRDEDRNSTIKLPGIGEIPLIGPLFNSHDDQSLRSDVLLTITPRVVRSWDIPSKKARDMYSGTANTYAHESLFSYLKSSADTTEQPRIALGGKERPSKKEVTGKFASPAQPSPVKTMQLAFDEASYTLNSNDEVRVQLVAENLAAINDMPIEILVNPQILKYTGIEPGDVGSGEVKASLEAGKGAIKLNVSNIKKAQIGEKNILGTLILKGVKPGISYLVYRTSTYKTSEGRNVRAQVKASRVVVK